ncbi:MAG: PTS sugar transporter subunit IIA [Hyphomonadaceae bacterium]
MTSLNDLLLPRVVLASAKWTTRKQVLQGLSESMGEALGIEGRVVYDAVLERERLGPTGVGEGVAIPHARVDGLEHPVAGFARLVEPVDFEAIDERKCDLVFMILAPLEAGAEHLMALARVSRMLRQESVRARLRVASGVDQILDVLCPKAAADSDAA